MPSRTYDWTCGRPRVVGGAEIPHGACMYLHSPPDWAPDWRPSSRYLGIFICTNSRLSLYISHPIVLNVAAENFQVPTAERHQMHAFRLGMKYSVQYWRASAGHSAVTQAYNRDELCLSKCYHQHTHTPIATHRIPGSCGARSHCVPCT